MHFCRQDILLPSACGERSRTARMGLESVRSSPSLLVGPGARVGADDRALESWIQKSPFGAGTALRLRSGTT